MSSFVPPRPRALDSRARFIDRARLFLRSGLALFLRGSYEFTGVSRHGLPRLPFRKQAYAYLVRDPDAVREVLVGQAARFPKSRLMDSMLRALTGYSIFISNGEAWRRQRAIIDQAFENARVREVFGLMREASEAFCQRLDARVPERGLVSIDIDVETMHFAGDVIFRTLFSEPMTEEDAREIFTAFERFQRIAFAHSYIALMGLPTFVLPSSWRGKRDAAAIRRALNRPIARRLERLARAEPAPDNDILATLISAPDPVTGTRFSSEELLDQVAMLFLAGHETSAAALGWALYLIANQPEIQTRMREEANSVLGARAPEFSDMRRLSLIRDVFQETLRLYPPVAFLARDSAEDTRLCDQSIEKHSQTIVPTWLMQRHALLWKDADHFNPDRFADPATKPARACAYFPFSMGPRVCSGAAFALQEATLALVELVRRFRFSPMPDHVPEPVSRLTVRSANGLPLRVERCQGADAEVRAQGKSREE
jgi:cytochrome P450